MNGPYLVRTKLLVRAETPHDAIVAAQEVVAQGAREGGPFVTWEMGRTPGEEAAIDAITRIRGVVEDMARRARKGARPSSTELYRLARRMGTLAKELDKAAPDTARVTGPRPITRTMGEPLLKSLQDGASVKARRAAGGDAE